MQKYLSTFVGSAICGGFAFGIWPELWKTYGLIGGWAAATLIIGIMWYMNHYNGMIRNPEGKIWLDQGWCIGSAGIAWGIVRFQGDLSAFWDAFPTLVYCLIGGALAGVAVAVIRKTQAKQIKEETV
ncbi:MAG: Lin0368 family putative glycerol transporter subunit [Bacteroidales bacterium]